MASVQAEASPACAALLSPLLSPLASQSSASGGMCVSGGGEGRRGVGGDGRGGGGGAALPPHVFTLNAELKSLLRPFRHERYACCASVSLRGRVGGVREKMGEGMMGIGSRC